MPEYQWKLTIIERNLLLSNWINLIPEAQECMLEEADQLMVMLPFCEQQRLLASLETLQHHAQAELHQRIQQILRSQMELSAA